MFTTFSSVPSRPSPSDVLREVQDVLDVRGITFGALIVNALRDTATSLGATIIPSLASILEALRPHLDEDENARALLGRFFASVASPELLRFEKDDDDGISWGLPATKLSTEQLAGFNLEEMGRKIASDAPAFSSFLGRICGGSKPDGHETDVAMDVDEIVEDGVDDGVDDGAEDDAEPGSEARRRVSPAQLLEIVSSSARFIFVAYIANRER